MKTNKSEKQTIRTKIRAKRLSLSNDEVLKASKKIFKDLMKLEEVKNAKSIHIYIDQDNEVITSDIILALKDKTLFTPSEDTTHISHRKIDIQSENIELSETIFKDCDFDVVIVPGIAFSKDGARIGYGGGYYDKFLKGKNWLKIGLCFNCQILSELPCEDHDVKMDLILSA